MRRAGGCGGRAHSAGGCSAGAPRPYSPSLALPASQLHPAPHETAQPSAPREQPSGAVSVCGWHLRSRGASIDASAVVGLWGRPCALAAPLRRPHPSLGPAPLARPRTPGGSPQLQRELHRLCAHLTAHAEIQVSPSSTSEPSTPPRRQAGRPWPSVALAWAETGKAAAGQRWRRRRRRTARSFSREVRGQGPGWVRWGRGHCRRQPRRDSTLGGDEARGCGCCGLAGRRAGRCGLQRGLEDAPRVQRGAAGCSRGSPPGLAALAALARRTSPHLL